MHACARLLALSCLRNEDYIAFVDESIQPGFPTTKATEAYYPWFWMCNALLVERSQEPRPKLSLTVIDGRDTKLREAQDLTAWRFYKAFPRCQAYVASGTEWFVGGSVLQDSVHSPFIQMADLVAGAARLAVLERAPEKDWYKDHLVRYARSKGRKIDVSHHARAELRRRSREDACRSGWKDAILVL
jgi:hypothetical protein